jgi:hypothetical protein
MEIDMTKAILGSVAAIALLSFAGGVAWKAGLAEEITDNSFGAIAICEDGIKGSLSSPSSYRRISAKFTPAGPLQFREYVAYRETKGVPMSDPSTGRADSNMAAIAYGTRSDWEHDRSDVFVRKYSVPARERYLKFQYDRYTKQPAEDQATGYVELSYDAANAFNAVNRNTLVCRFGPKNQGRFTERDMFFSQGARG